MTTEPLNELIEPHLRDLEASARVLLGERGYMPFGLTRLREVIAEFYNSLATPTSAEQVLITTGGQQAISLICTLLLQKGDHVLVENPTYFGALEAFRVAGARLVPLPITADHVSSANLAHRLVTVSPRVVYLTPTGQNPTGVIMPDSTRSDIARGSVEHGVTIVEDEALAEFNYGVRRPRPIASFHPDANVLTIGSLSKLFWPSLRVGWIRGPRSLIAKLARIKSAMDLGSALLPQSLAIDLMEEMRAARDLRRRGLTKSRDQMCELLRSHVPSASFSIPSSGLCLWVRLPGVDTQVLTQAALRYGVALAAGNLFSVDESHVDYVRMPFVLSSEFLERGVMALAAVLTDLTRPARPHSELALALT